MNCPFCHLQSVERISESEHLVAFLDKFPVSRGHVLIVPRAHAAGFDDLPAGAKDELASMVETVMAEITRRHHPSGFNVGWNDGAAAGQTIFHFHVHVIPRYDGDVADPRGGVRWVLPEKARYWDDKP